MFSIDQNCHSLWDVLPKLQALAAKGIQVRHFLEDVDVAFTSMGAAGEGEPLRLARERFHRSGGADWGAAMFYLQFLGRLPVEIRQWEPITGMKTNALARQLGVSVDDLYDEFSPSDNWQLIGPSYVGDRKHHRVVGDLSVAETAEFLRETFAMARGDCMERFPQADSQQRLGEWFDREESLVNKLLDECASETLIELYRRWLGEYLGDSVSLETTSSLLACDAEPGRAAMLELFLADYDQAATLYNESLEETNVGLRPLNRKDGELPFFAMIWRDGRAVRTAVYLESNAMRVGDRTFDLPDDRRLPIEALVAGGVRCLAGKAVLLVTQVRLGPHGESLALPYRGSLYMPAAHRFADKLRANGLLNGELRPIVRVRFRMLDRMAELDTIIRLPEHLAEQFNADEIPASRLAEKHARIAQEASDRLELFTDQACRDRWQRENFPAEAAAMRGLEQRRRELARENPKAPEIRELGKQQKQMQRDMLWGLVRRIAHDTQLADLDYFDSRGGLIPWCVALGGEQWCKHVIESAEIYEESPTPN